MTTELLGVLQEIVKNYMNAIKMTDKATGTVTKTSSAHDPDRYLPAADFRECADPDEQRHRADGAGEGWRRWNSNSHGRFKSGRQGPAPPSPKRAAVYCIIKDHIRRSSWQYYQKVWGLM